ncbi:MAG: polysaccharide biosynthesis C-terminal domain-containing protein, partial [Oscillospiraceae bacterium]|nr:polysaccharide biosynthesis C-terminal domain-containing protein [Oscillospiraceae bacterium]
MDNRKNTLAVDLTTGSATKQLLSFTAPLFASNALQAVYNIADMVIVGQFLGKEGMAGVSIGGEMLIFLTFLAMGFSNAGQVIIAQFSGAGRREHISKLIGTLFSFLGIAAVAMSVLCLVFRNGILGLMNTPAPAWDYAMDYTVVCCLGLVFIYGYNVVSAILRGMGDSRHPFIFISVATVLNIVLDLLFVIVFRMEVLGAALATVIGQAVSFITAIAYLIKNRDRFGFDFRLSSFKPDPSVFKTLCGLGIPMSIQSGAVRFSMLIITAWVNSFGVEFSALQGAASKLTMVAVL